jgi:hypothetical protein
MHKEKSNKLWLLIILFITLLFLSVGYSFFSESLSINATGVIGEPPASTLKEIILNNEQEVTTGDGLYKSSIDNKYHYSGSSVNNYISFNNELWRIISIDTSGNIKIIRNKTLSVTEITTLENGSSFWSTNADSTTLSSILSSGKVPFDIKGKRPLNTALASSYCKATDNGCNAYAISNYSGEVVDDDSLIKKFIDNVYYPSLTTDAKSLIIESNYNLGLVWTSTSKKSISSVYTSESSPTAYTNIGLANVSDYVLSSTNSNCQTAYDSSNCATSNWMYLSGYSWFLINGRYYTNTSYIFYVYLDGKITSQISTAQQFVRPVTIINGNKTGSGTGTQNDPYVIEVS